MSTFDISHDVFNEVLRLARQYHREAQKCEDAKAYLAGCVMVGAAFEAMLLAFMSCYSRQASKSSAAPRKGNSVKPLIRWSLAELLAVAKERNWLPAGLSPNDDWDQAKAKIGDYGELIREFRNLAHPARYAIDRPRSRITKKYLEAVFEILEVAHDYLQYALNISLRKTIERQERLGA